MFKKPELLLQVMEKRTKQTVIEGIYIFTQRRTKCIADLILDYLIKKKKQ